jgi:hypothetical protein
MRIRKGKAEGLMNTETLFRTLFFALLGSVLMMRFYFTIRVRMAGEHFLPDRQAVQREGQILFIVRAGLFFLLFAFLALYAINPPWIAVFQVQLPRGCVGSDLSWAWPAWD